MKKEEEGTAAGGGKESGGFSISARSFLGSLAVIAFLMILTFVLTKLIPSGEFERVIDASGNSVIRSGAAFRYTEGGISFLKWLFSPVLVLGSSGSGLLIAVIVFLLVIGGIFSALDSCGLMRYMMEFIIHRFGAKKYRLLAVLLLFFMGMGSLVGSFEEVVPMVPITTAVAVALGWDDLTGLSLSLLAAGCGFAAGVCNPFTIGVAQTLAGLPMFSGILLRLLSFALIYGLLFAFVYLHAKKTEEQLRGAGEKRCGSSFRQEEKQEKALKSFCLILGAGILTVLASGFIPALQDLTLVVIAAAFLAGGITACVRAGMERQSFLRDFAHGVLSMLPAVLMILMASSIRYTLEEAGTLDTILYGAVGLAETLPRWAVVLFIYLIVLVMNFFISSGSAKAFMLIPIILPLAQIFGISSQLCILAFAFGDGFSNVFYPTNPGLLVSLSLSGISYGKWFRHSWKFQAANLLLTCGILLLGLAAGY